ncbi:MAG TPA: SusC/RagA family TonB-linked outer membrane protein [Gemmatirosa sp.]|jgi:TonB-linked SusC/RagA family outer membrane protein|nr:SusC/RagA family TonB-linked outer membrane protein [Gemmatirosa sp.]
MNRRSLADVAGSLAAPAGRVLVTVAAGAAGMVALAAPTTVLAQATTGVVRGRVTAQGTNQPVAETQVLVVGTQVGARTDAQGNFRLVGVPAGALRVRALRIGYGASVQPVTLRGGDTVTVNFTLAQSALELSQVVVTATGEQVARREQGISVATINVDTTPLAPIQNFSQLVQGRAAGVSITQSGGTVGAGATVRIRGGTSLQLSNEPLLVIDGVRINSAAESQSIDVGGQYPSRLNDLNPEDIESIEVLKGPAASALYGTAAANGVIQVTTRRGRAGRTQWNSWVENGRDRNPWSFPDNYGIIPAGGDSTDVGACTVVDVGTGDCAFGSLQRFNPLNASEIFRSGVRQQYGASVSGGNAATTYFISGEFEANSGIVKSNDLTRQNVRANLQGQPASNFTIGVQAGYLNSLLKQPQNDNNGNGILPQGLLGSPVNDANGGFFAFDPSTTLRLRTQQGIDRFTGSTNATWTATSWLNLITTAGLDVLQRDEDETLPPNVFLDSPDNIAGTRERNRLAVQNYTATQTAAATFRPKSWLTSTTTLGVQFLRQNQSGTFANGGGLLEGTGSLEGTTTRFEVGELNQDERTFGYLGQQQFALRERLFVTASFRSDRSSNFGANVGFVTYPQFQASYVISDEDYFPKTNWLSTLRLRGAWGQSGNPPAFRSARAFYTPAAIRVQGSEVVGFTFGGTGNQRLDPEVVSEGEIGFDAGFLNNRLGLEFTVWNRSANDAIVARRIAPSVGVSSTRVENIGEIASNGIEGQLRANVVQRADFALDLALNFQTLNQKLVRLREGVDPIIFGLGGNSQRHEPGYWPGGYWANPYTYTTATVDGRQVVDNVEIDFDQQVFLGTPVPKRELGFIGNATLFKWLRLGTLVDYRGGHKLYNATEEFRCAFGVCRGINDPSATVEEQAAAVAAANGTIAGFVEDADFVRLRELSVTASLPDRYARAVRARGLALTLAGRNLALWSKYGGADPEINGGAQAAFSRFDFLSQPPVRSFVARVQFTF